jgi:hypothetical protein
MTGASGAPYAVRLLEVLLASGRDVHLSISPSAQTVLWQELGLRVSLDNSNSTSNSDLLRKDGIGPARWPLLILPATITPEARDRSPGPPRLRTT